MDGDIEANEEFEFETDEGQFDRAVAFVTSLGYEVVAKKTKRGLSYSLAWGDGLGDLTIELCEVSTLGWFIEMEFVLEKRAQVEDAKRALAADHHGRDHPDPVDEDGEAAATGDELGGVER